MTSTAQIKDDPHVVMTLDAGGTSFRFSAMRGGAAVTETITLPSNGNDLPACLENIRHGFGQVRAKCPVPPDAISFAFPGPADYPNGIIGDLGNLPGFRGGVALGPMLEEQFQVPVFINNDGDLFALGEATAGFLPHVNRLLEEAGSSKRYKNLVGLTLGTGFGGGIVSDGRLFAGDNSSAGEVWLLRSKDDPKSNVEEGASIRAVRRGYAQLAGIPFESAPDPRQIEMIAQGKLNGSREAAEKSYQRLGETVGDALASVLALADGLAVIGGGLSKGWRLFMPALMEELNGHYAGPAGNKFRRLGSTAFDLEDPAQMKKFLAGGTREINVPGSARRIKYDPLQRVGIGISRLGTSEAIAIGAAAFALAQLEKR